MKLQQLRYIWEVAHHDLNVSATAQSLYTSQPGISKQIRLLEDELGVEIFARSGKHLTHITPAGEAIIAMAGEVLRRVEGIRQVAQEYCNPRRGTLTVATTQAQARYVLPGVIRAFCEQYPDVALQVQQGSPPEAAELAASGQAHFALVTEGVEHFHNLVVLPCYRWNHAILVPRGHPLSSASRISLSDLALFPLVSYSSGFSGRARLDEAFSAAALQPRIVCTAADADVIKTYVRLGLGVGVVGAMVHDPVRDDDLLALDARHLFRDSVTRLAIARGTFLREYMYDFIGAVAPHLNRPLVEQAMTLRQRTEVESLLAQIELPLR